MLLLDRLWNLMVPLRWRRYHFVAVIVGVETGTVHRLAFARFRDPTEAQTWCDIMNRKPENADGLARYEIRPR